MAHSDIGAQAEMPVFHRYIFAAAAPWYCALPKPRMGKKINGSKIKLIAKPTPFPKLFATSMQRMIQVMKFTNGMNIRITHQPGRPATLHKK
jgi:hypothetical protein